MKGILFVDRNEDLLVAMKVFIESEGFFCFATSSYEQAFASLSAVIPDLILLDFTDEEQGQTLLLKLMSHASYRSIPIVIALAKDQKLKFPKTSRITAIEKPFNLLEVHRILKSIA